MPLESLLDSHRVIRMPVMWAEGFNRVCTILMKSFIMVSPLNGNTSETRGIMMSVAAVNAFRVIRPREGGQSKKMKP